MWVLKLTYCFGELIFSVSFFFLLIHKHVVVIRSVLFYRSLEENESAREKEEIQ